VAVEELAAGRTAQAGGVDLNHPEQEAEQGMSEKETPQQAAEAAAIRRRWITLGEVLAVVAVVISGLTFWNSYRERTAAEAERQAEKQDQAERAQTVLLKATASSDGKQLLLAPADSDQVIQGLTIRFPTAVEARPIDAVIEPRIEAGWIEDAVKKIDSPAPASGDLRLPIVIATRFVVDGTTYEDVALYDVGYRIDRGLLDSDVALRGLSQIERARASSAQARLDAIWKSRIPPAPAKAEAE
jgi:hypothetical protein